MADNMAPGGGGLPPGGMGTDVAKRGKHGSWNVQNGFGTRSWFGKGDRLKDMVDDGKDEVDDKKGDLDGENGDDKKVGDDKKADEDKEKADDDKKKVDDDRKKEEDKSKIDLPEAPTGDITFDNNKPDGSDKDAENKKEDDKSKDKDGKSAPEIPFSETTRRHRHPSRERSYRGCLHRPFSRARSRGAGARTRHGIR
jgi:hypothetical protein